MLTYVRNNLPAEIDGYPTDFYRTFAESIGPLDPEITDPTAQAIAVLQNLDVWGIPTSRPLRDPTTPGSYIVRLERGFFRFEPACRCTAPIPMGRYFRSRSTSADVA